MPDARQGTSSIAVAGFGTDGATSGTEELGVANGLGDAKTNDDGADLGSHDLQATWTPADGDDDDTLTSNTVSVVVAGAAAQGDVGTDIETLRPGQVATVEVLFTDADGNIAPDGTPTRIIAAGQTFAATGVDTVSGTTSNGRVSATLLPSGSDAVVTILAQAGEALEDTPSVATATATGQVIQSSGTLAPVAATVVVTAGSTELAMGESTRVSATVMDADGDPVAGARVRFSEGPALTAVDSTVQTTGADGSASAVFTAVEAGDFAVTATVVELTEGQVVNTAVSGSVTITVAAPEPVTPEPVTPEPVTPEPVTPEPVTLNPSYTVWTGSSTTAAQAFAGLDVSIWRWSGTAWELYSTDLPESLRVNYALEPNDVLFNAGAAVTVQA